MHSLHRCFLICFISITFWGYIDRTAAYASKLSLDPGIYRLTIQAYEKKSVDNTNILSKYAYVSYDNIQKNTKIIFLPKNGTW